VSPREMPSAMPSVSPREMPSAMPSVSPREMPSAMPSVSPSANQSAMQSAEFHPSALQSNAILVGGGMIVAFVICSFFCMYRRKQNKASLGFGVQESVRYLSEANAVDQGKHWRSSGRGL